MSSDFSLNGKRALITGGGTGLGFGISSAFVRAGARVMITGRREKILSDACKKLGTSAEYRVHDITVVQSTPGLINELETGWGPIDILVNNAGINMKKEPLQVTDEEFESVIRTNLNGLFAISREVAKGMAERNKGSIVMITSMAAIYGIPQVPAYTASKSAVLGLTRSLAVDLSAKGVRVNAIAPGFINSRMLQNAFRSDPGRKQKVLDRTPMNCLGKPEDIALAAVYLASDASRFVTGVNLPVDGGNSIGF